MNPKVHTKSNVSLPVNAFGMVSDSFFFSNAQAGENRRVCTPTYRVALLWDISKGKSDGMIFERHTSLKHRFEKLHFWAIGYYVSTVRIHTATVQHYIREQDKMETGLSKKEYIDPLKKTASRHTTIDWTT